ncbi:protogenin B-like [Cyprinus carpio]|uniref:Protogenin B-like n=1 Tax=Cyprinus carpio TaxID=7962 RepID=A0A9Q9ZS06_CYPCA|nr:protogenin B-like [Cyprinus carpio]
MGSLEWKTHQQSLILLWVLSFSGVLGFSELSFSVEPTDVTASLGERVVLDCQAQGESPVSLRWRRDGVQLQESGGVRVLSNGSLFISSSAPADQGFYQCLAHNRHGAVLSRTSQLTVSDVLSLVTHHQWTFFSLFPLIFFTDVSLSSGPHSRNSAPAESPRWAPCSSNSSGETRESDPTQSRYGPSSSAVRPKDKPVPTPESTWFKNGQVIPLQRTPTRCRPEARESEPPPSPLQLDTPTEDSGIGLNWAEVTQEQTHYLFCFADPRVRYHVKLLAFSANGEGYQAHQTVNTPGCPSTPNRRLAALPPPDHIHATANSSSMVRLGWGRPAFSSGKAVSYSVRYGPVSPSDASTVRYVQTSEQTVTVTGLRPNTRYEFAVRLHMDQMSSPWSTSVYQRTLLEAPWSPPLSVRVSLIEDDTALVSWKQPDQPDLSVTHYTVLYASRSSGLAGDWQVLQREGTITMALLEKLVSGNIYLVKISASNPAGDGPFSSTVELRLRSKRNTGTRHSSAHACISAASIDGLKHIDETSMSGIIAGVCIALSFIILCVFILLTKSKAQKSASSKMIGRVRNDVMSSGASSANQQQVENTHFIDAKGGTNLMINQTGPVMSDAQNKRKKWSVFNNNQKSNGNKGEVLRTVSSDVGQTEDPAGLSAEGKNRPVNHASGRGLSLQLL